jgi:DNA-directed RNA polymerase subunit RPC12/RpoP
MAMLRVRCTKCSRLIPTDYDVDYETFKSLTDTERTLECPHCEETQVWNLDDVDRSVFKS